MLVLLFLSIVTSALGHDYNQALHFPKEVSVDNYVAIQDPDFSKISSDREVSVCTWMKKFLNPEVQHIWFSYAIASSYNDLMLSDWYHNIIGSDDKMVWNNVMLKNEWYHFCVTWSSETSMDLYLNGVLVNSKTTSKIISDGGLLIIGQDQDTLGGGYDINQSFGGELYQLNVFERKLRREEVVGMYFDGRCSDLTSSLKYDLAVGWEEFINAPRNGKVQLVSAGCENSGNADFLGKVAELVFEEMSMCSDRRV